MICIRPGLIVMLFGLCIAVCNYNVWIIIHPWSFNLPDRDLKFWNILHLVLAIFSLLVWGIGSYMYLTS